MFNKENNTISQNEAETVIGPSIKVKGNFHGNGSMIIEGEVEGSVKTKNFLLIGNSAKINANISAKDAKISGKVVGDIQINNYIEISSTAEITGNINTSKISIEKGAKINGKITTGQNIETSQK